MKISARLGILLAIVAMALAPSAHAAETVVGSWLPPGHPMNAEVLPTWGKWISDATDGRVKMKIKYHDGHPNGIFTGVEDGAYDAGWSYHGYLSERFKLTKMAELPLLNAGAKAASVAYWRVHEKYLAAANEHDGLVVVGVFTHGPGQIMMREPISGFAGMKGKKIRVGGDIQSEVAERLGVVAVPAPGPKVYEILSAGTTDGTFMPIGEQKTSRLSEVAKHIFMLPQGMYLGSFSIFMNPDFLNGLPDADRKAILSVSGEALSELAGHHWQENDAAGLRAARTAGNTIVEASAAEQAAFKKLVDGIEEAWYDEVKDRGVDAKAALAEFRRTARQ